MKKLSVFIFAFLLSFSVFHNEIVIYANTENVQYYCYNNGVSYLDETTVPNGQIITGATGQIRPEQDSLIKDTQYAFLYEVSNPSVLTIDERGNWQALKEGTVTVTIHVPYLGGDFPNFEAELDQLGIHRSPIETSVAYPPKTFTVTVSNNNLIPVNRLYYPALKTHLYTTDFNEVNELMRRGWRLEGKAWSTRSITGDAVYRLYHSGLKVHLYTKDANEYRILAGRGWHQEGIAYRSTGDIPVYRLYHNGIKKTPLYHQREREKHFVYSWLEI